MGMSPWEEGAKYVVVVTPFVSYSLNNDYLSFEVVLAKKRTLDDDAPETIAAYSLDDISDDDTIQATVATAAELTRAGDVVRELRRLLDEARSKAKTEDEEVKDEQG